MGWLFRKSASALVDEAKRAYAANQLEHSVRLFGEAWARGGCDIDALHIFAVACHKTGRDPVAADALAEALRLEFALPAGDAAGTVEALVDLTWKQPVSRWQHRVPAIERLGWVHGRCGGYAEWGAAVLDRLAARDPGSLSGTGERPALNATLRLLDFSRGSRPEWLEEVFNRVVWPWMRRALDADRYDQALLLETEAYGAYVLHNERGEHFRRAFGVWSDAMRSAGRRAACSLTPLPPAPREALPAVAFYLHSGAMLGHTQILVEFLEAHAQLAAPLIRPLVCVRASAQAPLRARLSAAGVPCIDLEENQGGGSDWQALRRLRALVAERQVTAVVWVSVAIHLAFAFSVRIAPVQIWWAMKYHSLSLPEIDGYLTNQSAGSTKLVEGRVWRSAPLASEEWYRPELGETARQVRARYARHDLLFSCMGREEKINSPAFLEAVGAILRACPAAGFLWTGRERAAQVQEAFERMGVAERCHYIGWVDTKLYAQVLDVFLDSFPFPCGFTLYEAMAAGKPVVIYGSPESAETGFHGLISPLLEGTTGSGEEVRAAIELFQGGRLLHCASTPSEYVALAVQLSSDAQARRAAGEANRAFVQRFLSDRQRMAHVVGQHFVELIKEADPSAWH